MIAVLLWRQPRRWWRSWPRRNRLQAWLVMLVLVAVPFDYLYPALKNAPRTVFYQGVLGFVSLWNALLSVSLRFGVRRNALTSLLADAPLTSRRALHVTAYAAGKYLTGALLFFVPFITAALAARPLFAAGLLAGFFCVIALTAAAVMLAALKRGLTYAFLYAALFILTSLAAFFNHFMIPGAALVILPSLLTLIFYNDDTQPDLRLLLPDGSAKKPSAHPWRLTARHPLPGFAAGALYRKERLARQRHKPLVRMQFLLWGIWLTGILIILLRVTPDMREVTLALFYTLWVWATLALRFSSGYNAPDDPDWVESTPIRVSNWFTALFATEAANPLAAGLLMTAALRLTASPVNPVVSVIVMTLAALMLTGMAVFRIMFYDDPRKGARAFHLSTLFMTVLAYNYPLVGVLVSAMLMVFFMYKNYRYLNT